MDLHGIVVFSVPKTHKDLIQPCVLCELQEGYKMGGGGEGEGMVIYSLCYWGVLEKQIIFGWSPKHHSLVLKCQVNGIYFTQLSFDENTIACSSHPSS